MNKVTLGGDRLGTGNKNKVELHGYGRSTHNLSEVWRSSMSAGTLVPFLNIVALPGDSFDIDLQVDVKTHPTIGPLFGSYKVQVDIFQCPVRLYQGLLHMNMLNIGNKIAQIKLPQISLTGNNLDMNKELTGQQINPSCIMAYLGTRGLGQSKTKQTTVQRDINAVPLLAYWDIYKNYYANKQEEFGYVIHNDPNELSIIPALSELKNVRDEDWNVINLNLSQDPATPVTYVTIMDATNLSMNFTSIEEVDPNRVSLYWNPEGDVNASWKKLPEIFNTIIWDDFTDTLVCTEIKSEWINVKVGTGIILIDRSVKLLGDVPVKLQKFPLKDIDNMRVEILRNTQEGETFYVDSVDLEPYRNLLRYATTAGKKNFSLTGNQEGLGLKTYLSDIFNNWINTEWIEGEGGINEITALSTTDGSITIDEINLANKIYNMLMRIAVSDGTFDSYISATYDHNVKRRIESPIYMGGMFQELVFQEVISNSATELEPLGSLAGRGKLAQNKKGGNVTIKVDEHSYIMGIVSLTPRIDYSQGNEWHINLKSMDDFHKPPLDEIGFQDLITDQMTFWDTTIETSGATGFRSAGKQPAWINYMTSYNRTFGNFALENQQMFMTLNRRYAPTNIDERIEIKDLTTYIDPQKFNQIFADTRRDSQNFWVQIGSNIKARRKMSAKVMPNL